MGISEETYTLRVTYFYCQIAAQGKGLVTRIDRLFKRNMDVNFVIVEKLYPKESFDKFTFYSRLSGYIEKNIIMAPHTGWFLHDLLTLRNEGRSVSAGGVFPVVSTIKLNDNIMCSTCKFHKIIDQFSRCTFYKDKEFSFVDPSTCCCFFNDNSFNFKLRGNEADHQVDPQEISIEI